MLGRKTYTPEEVDRGKSAVAQQLAAYDRLADAAASTPGNQKARAALQDFEVVFFNNMTIALDRYFVYRLRVVTGKDTNPLNEVELLTDSLMKNAGVLRGNNVIKLVPDESVLKLHPGDHIRMTRADFERLSAAFFADLERKFL